MSTSEALRVLKNVQVLLNTGMFNHAGSAIHEAIEFINKLVADAEASHVAPQD